MFCNVCPPWTISYNIYIISQSPHICRISPCCSRRTRRKLCRSDGHELSPSGLIGSWFLRRAAFATLVPCSEMMCVRSIRIDAVHRWIDNHRKYCRNLLDIRCAKKHGIRWYKVGQTKPLPILTASGVAPRNCRNCVKRCHMLCAMCHHVLQVSQSTWNQSG